MPATKPGPGDLDEPVNIELAPEDALRIMLGAEDNEPTDDQS
jgi:hypothetical protein